MVGVLRETMVECAERREPRSGSSCPSRIDRRLEAGLAVGDHKTSMLQDLEAGKPLETACLSGAVLELADRLGVPTPHTRTIHACLELLQHVRAARAGRRRSGQPALAVGRRRRPRGTRRTPPCRRASPSRRRRRAAARAPTRDRRRRRLARAPTARIAHGPSPAPTKTCSVQAGQWTKSQARSRRSSPSISSRHSPESTRKSSWSSSPWYMQAGWPGSSTPMLIPICGNRASPSNLVYAPKSPSRQSASRAFRTNQPSPSGTRPAPVERRGASFNHSPDSCKIGLRLCDTPGARPTGAAPWRNRERKSDEAHFGQICPRVPARPGRAAVLSRRVGRRLDHK